MEQVTSTLWRLDLPHMVQHTSIVNVPLRSVHVNMETEARVARLALDHLNCMYQLRINIPSINSSPQAVLNTCQGWSSLNPGSS